jgi:hypothetical protein
MHAHKRIPKFRREQDASSRHAYKAQRRRARRVKHGTQGR